jgi:RNA polymerase sigma-70 factor (ECF subfamily)
MVIDLLDQARAGDADAFADLVAPHRRELTMHCYRMLGSVDDADDAVQEALMAAWRGLSGFEGRSSLRSWLYRIATNVCLRMAQRRPRRLLSWDRGPARDPVGDLGSPVTDDHWLDPWIEAGDDPAEWYARREAIELAYVAALQRLPPNQRAVLILRDVLDFPAADTAELLDTSIASVNSALQRARATLAKHTDRPAEPVDAERRAVVDAFVAAFEKGDVPALVELLAEDVRFTMPPLPAWFAGRTDVAAFFAQRSLVTPWQVRRRVQVNGQPGLLGYQLHEGGWRPGALLVLDFAGTRIGWIASFLDPAHLSRADR